MDFNPFYSGAGGLLGGALGSMFGGYQDPAKAAMPELDKIPETLRPYYQPFIEAGQRQIPGLENQYNSLMNNPGGMINHIGQSYQQSPGFQFALNQALGASDRAMAAGGMAGTPMHSQDNMQLATQLANQDYYNWLNPTLNMYNRGLAGSENMMNTGYQAGNEIGQSLGNMQLQKALMNYLGAMGNNQHEQGMWGALGGGLGTLAGSFF